MSRADGLRRHPLALGLLLGLWLAAGAGCPRGRPPAPRGTLRLALPSEPPTLDWDLATDGTSIRVLQNLMEGLTEYDDELRPVPALADRWEVLDGGRRYLFHLREGVRWTDGRPVVAQDFVDGWHRLLDPKMGAEYAYFLYDVTGARDFNAGKFKDFCRVGVHARGPRMLEVRLRKPIVFFPSLMTFTATFPIRADVIARWGDRWTEPRHLVTEGPYRLLEWRHEYRLTLAANPDYWGGAPKIPRVVFFAVEEPATALTLYETGGLDVLGDLVAVPPVALPSLARSPELHRHPFLRGYYYGFNVHKPPFDDPRVRRAFAHAVDRTEIPRFLQGGEIPATSWIPPGMFAFHPSTGLGFNPTEARALLAEAGYPGGRGFPSVTAAFNTDPEHRRIAENLQAQWERALGVHVRLENMEWKVYLKRLQTDAPMLFRLGWGADYPDPDNFMELFTSRSGNNNTGWASPAYDGWVQAAASEPDPRRRAELYERAQRLLLETDAVILPLFFAQENVLIRPRVRGLKLNAMDVLLVKRLDLRD